MGRHIKEPSWGIDIESNMQFHDEWENLAETSFPEGVCSSQNRAQLNGVFCSKEYFYVQ